MADLISNITGWLSAHWATIVRIIMTIGFGLLAARWLGRLASVVVTRRGSPQTAMLARRFVAYGCYIIIAMTVLGAMGFDLKVLAGAAGLFTVAIGFASQTSASNLISGLFLVAERPFMIGDTIRIAQTTGEVVSIDLLSIKLRTFDNLFVRIPNESVIKTEVTNLTHFPIRRFDLPLSVGYATDLGKVRSLLIEVARTSPRGLDEPEPKVLFLGYGDSGMQLQLSAWATKEDFVEFRYALAEQVKRALDDAGIEVPFPHRTVLVRGPISLQTQGAQTLPEQTQSEPPPIS